MPVTVSTVPPCASVKSAREKSGGLSKELDVPTTIILFCTVAGTMQVLLSSIVVLMIGNKVGQQKCRDPHFIYRVGPRH